jgi:hypothetical protein
MTIVSNSSTAFGDLGDEAMGIPPKAKVRFELSFLGWRDPATGTLRYRKQEYIRLSNVLTP